MSTPVGIIKKFIQALIDTKSTGTEAANEAFKAVGASSYKTFKSKFYSAYNKSSSTKDFLEEICGVRITNDDTGAITGSDAGGKTTKTAESIVPETAAAVELTSAQYKSFTKNGLTVNVTYDDYADVSVSKQKLVTRALYNWWIPEALDLINESLGLNFTDGRANINTLNIKFDGEAYNDEVDEVRLNFNYDLGLASKATLTIGTDYLSKITKTDKNGTLDYSAVVYSDLFDYDGMDTKYLDRLVLQALAEFALKANVPYVQKLPRTVAAGLVAIVGGFDDYSTYPGDFIADNEPDDEVSGGYSYMRYLAKNYSDGMPDGVSYNAKKTVLTLTTDFADSAVDLADFESTVKTVKASALKRDIKILGNDKANSIVSGAGDDSLNGGKGNDTLNGGKGDDTLRGGSGNDVFIFAAGNDLIADYAEGDKISVSGTISDIALDASNVIITVGKNILTVKNAKDLTLTIINGGEEYQTVAGDSAPSTTLTLDNKTTSPVTIDGAVEYVDASARTKAVKITGNALDNIISGGSGKDTLIGGKGDDLLLGGLGADVFVYTLGDGDDTIADYELSDKISLASGAAEISESGDDLVFTVSNSKKTGTITVLNGGGKIVTYIEGGVEKFYRQTESSDGVEFNAKGTAVTLTEEYEADSFNVADYSAYVNKVITIEASAVQQSLEIIANKKANKITGTAEDDLIDGLAGGDKIYGGKGDDTLIGGAGSDSLFGQAGNDSLWGGDGSDTLIGGAGKDVFVYKDGDGEDIIDDFDSSLDKIRVLSGDIGTPTVDKAGDVTFAVGDGSIVVKGGADKYIPIYDKGKNILVKYTPR